MKNKEDKMAESKWLWPVPYTINITQYYTGAYADGEHSGIDISDTGVSGKAVVASKSGTVPPPSIKNGHTSVSKAICQSIYLMGIRCVRLDFLQL